MLMLWVKWIAIGVLVLVAVYLLIMWWIWWRIK
jgi:hypothetical protein